MKRRLWSFTSLAALAVVGWCLTAGNADAQFYGRRGGVGISIGTGPYGGNYWGSGYGNYRPYGTGYGYGNYGGWGNYGGYGNYGGWGYNPGISLGFGSGSGITIGSNYGGWGYRPGYYGGVTPYAYNYGYTPGYGYASVPAYSYSPGYYGGANYAGYTPGVSYQSSYPPSGGISSVPENSASISVLVPANAEVWFDGSPTQQTGANREFMTPSLTPGKTFTYEVKARWMGDNNQPVEQTRTVSVSAGKQSTVDFNSPQK